MGDISNKGCTQIFVLGDIINGVDPAGCIEILLERQAAPGAALACIRGNAEAYLLTPDLEAIPTADQPGWHQEVLELIEWFRAQLSETQLAWIRSFPDYILWKEACLVHDSHIDRLSPESWHKPGIDPKYQEWFYHAPGILPDMPTHEWQKLIAYMQRQNFKHVFCAHTHMPFIKECEDRVVCNVGSVGAPLDSDPRAAWVMLEEVPGKQPEITIRRVEYDISAIHQRIAETPDYPDFKLPGHQAAYKKWLATGIHWRAHLPE